MKNEYDLLNNVEIDFSEYEIEEVNELEKKKMMSKFLKTKNKAVFWNKKRIISVAAVIFVAINLGFNSDKVLATVGRFKYSINQWLGNIDSKDEYVAQLDIGSQCPSIIVNEFFADNSRVIINFNVNDEIKDIEGNKNKLVPDIYVNDKKVNRSSDYLGYRIQEDNVILELEMENLSLNNSDNIKLVFKTLAKDRNANESDFTYSFNYDSSSYKNASKVINVNKSIKVDENELYIENITVAPDRVLISGSSEGFSAWGDTNYYYDILNENGEQVPLKEEIGKGAYFYRYCMVENEESEPKEVSILRIVPYTFNKINTSNTSVNEDGRTKYILEDKIININLK